MSNVSPNYGYAQAFENIEALKRDAVALPKMTYSAPEEIDPRGWLKVENQGPMGSCQGHALSTCCEYAYKMQTGEAVQFSRLFGYLGTQKIDGLLGNDRGSTIDGGRRLVQQHGICKESTMPYPNPVRYTTRFAQGAYEEAADFRIKSHSMCRSYDDVFNYLASGVGAVEIGISWGGLRIQNDVGVSFSGGGGGHAVSFVGYSKEKDNKGNNLLWLANSWGEDWQGDGYIKVLPRVVDQMAHHQYTVMIGLSDMTTPEPRHISWIGKNNSMWA